MTRCFSGDAEGLPRRTRSATLAALAFYAIVVCLVAVAQRDRINPDGIVYIRNVLYLSQGRWFDSVSGYWSPLLSWCIAPLVHFGVDGLDASHIVTGVWGAMLLVGAAAFIGRCTPLAMPWNLLALLPIGLATAYWATCTISPDVPLAALIAWYFCFAARPDILVSRRSQILAGLFGGLAFLAKSYAFPLFAAHYSLSILLHFIVGRPNATPSQAIRAWLSGFLVFAIVAGPWVGVLSFKYGKFTFSTAAAFNHYVAGPPDGTNKFDVFYRAQPVPPGRLTVWETPEKLEFKDWSPFASSALLKYQVKYVAKNFQKIVKAVAQFDLFAIVPGVLLLMPVVRRAARRRGETHSYPVAWSLMTVAVYAGGYLPLAFETRYIQPVLLPLCCVLVFCVLADMRRLAQTGEHARQGTALVSLLAVFCALSLAAAAASRIVSDAVSAPSGKHPSPYRICGDKLRESGCTGPVATGEGFWDEGLCIAYHASLPFLGEIRATSAATVEKSLDQHGVRAFVASSKWNLFEEFSHRTKWRLLYASDAGGDADKASRSPRFAVWINPERINETKPPESSADGIRTTRKIE